VVSLTTPGVYHRRTHSANFSNTISKIRNYRLEQLATFAVITVIIDFLIFMSFYPAGLSLVIELMFTKAGRPQWDNKQIIKSLPVEETLNSVVYRSVISVN
jgi:hydroxymethylglutaryl-CoA reductase (NADPH)